MVGIAANEVIKVVEIAVNSVEGVADGLLGDKDQDGVIDGVEVDIGSASAGIKSSAELIRKHQSCLLHSQIHYCNQI